MGHGILRLALPSPLADSESHHTAAKEHERRGLRNGGHARVRGKNTLCATGRRSIDDGTMKDRERSCKQHIDGVGDRERGSKRWSRWTKYNCAPGRDNARRWRKTDEISRIDP